MPKIKKKTENGTSQQTGVAPLYPEVTTQVYLEGLTAEEAKSLIGWNPVEKGGVPELKALAGVPVELRKNARNRPLIPSWVLTLRQDILNGKWKFNGESIVVSKSGMILSGQHRLVALILAHDEWRGGKGRYRAERYWPDSGDGPRMPTLVVYGVDDSDETFRTLNTGKPATLVDVLYRSDLFSSMKADKRKAIGRMAEYAVKLLWSRTGAVDDAFAPRRTHGESIDFMARHPYLMTCIKHIYGEDQDGAVRKFISPGYAAGLMYLMTFAASDGDIYRAGDPPVEKGLDRSMEDKAGEFWVMLNTEEGKPLRYALGNLANVETGVGGSIPEKIGTIIKAWNLWSSGIKLKEGDLELAYSEDEDGNRKLIEHPTIKGIDVGKSRRGARGKGEGEGGELDNNSSSQAAGQGSQVVKEEVVPTPTPTPTPTPSSTEQEVTPPTPTPPTEETVKKTSKRGKKSTTPAPQA